MHNGETTSEGYIQNLFNIPQNIRVESIISIGYPSEKKAGIPKDKLPFKKIRMNKYSITLITYMLFPYLHGYCFL